MGYKRGFRYSTNKDGIVDKNAFVWFDAMHINMRDPSFRALWDRTDNMKRGIVHTVGFTPEIDVFDNASPFVELVQSLGENNWNNGVPILVDIWTVPEKGRFDLDALKVYGEYLKRELNPKVRPILRVYPSTWNSWYTKNSIEAIKLLGYFELSFLVWGMQSPPSVQWIGYVNWAEYANGLYAYDSTGVWVEPLNTVTPPPPPPDDDEEPGEEEEPGGEVFVEIRGVKEYKISLLGGLITGKITPVYDDQEE